MYIYKKFKILKILDFKINKFFLKLLFITNVNIYQLGKFKIVWLLVITKIVVCNIFYNVESIWIIKKHFKYK